MDHLVDIHIHAQNNVHANRGIHCMDRIQYNLKCPRCDLRNLPRDYLANSQNHERIYVRKEFSDEVNGIFDDLSQEYLRMMIWNSWINGAFFENTHIITFPHRQKLRIVKY